MKTCLISNLQILVIENCNNVLYRSICCVSINSSSTSVTRSIKNEPGTVRKSSYFNIIASCNLILYPVIHGCLHLDVLIKCHCTHFTHALHSHFDWAHGYITNINKMYNYACIQDTSMYIVYLYSIPVSKYNTTCDSALTKWRISVMCICYIVYLLYR